MAARSRSSASSDDDRKYSLAEDKLSDKEKRAVDAILRAHVPGYVCKRFIAEGGFGQVFQLTSVDIPDKSLALKKVNKDDVNPLEIVGWEMIDSHFLVTLESHFETEGYEWFTMNFYSRGDVWGKMNSLVRPSRGEARKWTYQLVSAIEHLSSLKFSHGDVKLRNLLITDGNDVKLADFGFMKLCQSFCQSYHGTWGFMSPEIVQRIPYNTVAADVYACGVCALLMFCTERNPRNIWDDFGAIRADFEWDSLSSAPKNLIRGMVAKSPSKRLQLHEIKNSKVFIGKTMLEPKRSVDATGE